MIGYKAAFNENTRVVITLEIPDDALTNMDRSSVVVKEKAKHRTNKVKVLKIEDKQGKEYETAETGFFRKKILVYRVDETLEEPTYDTDIEQVCSRGIHFFLDKTVAEQYEILEIDNGLLESFYDTGQKDSAGSFKNGKKDGLWEFWHENGQKSGEGSYESGGKYGLWQYWYDNGQKDNEGFYGNNGKDGVWTHWYDNGQKESEVLFDHNPESKLLRSWNRTGREIL